METVVVIQLVDFYKGKLTQKKVLEVLNVSRTTFNRWKKQLSKDKEDSELVKLVERICKQNMFRSGYRKITHLVN